MKQILLHLLVAASVASALPALAENKIPDELKTGGFFIGCQAYTFNRYTAFEAIEKCALAGGNVIEFFPGQKLSKEELNLTVDQNATPETIQKLKEKLAKHKMRAVN